jgi:hypothetical protein
VGATRGRLLIVTVVALAILSLSIGAVFHIVRGELRRERFDRGEREAARTLRKIALAQEHFRTQRWIDADRDGHGEFGFLQELCGTAWRDDRRPSMVPRLDPALGSSVRSAFGIASWEGYAVLLYLPGARRAVPESDPLPRPNSPGPVVDRQESHWVAYAWPLRYGTTGRRAFAVDETMEVVETANDRDPYQGVTDRVPAASAAYDDHGAEPGNLGSGFAWHTGGHAVDGRDWRTAGSR